MQKDTSYVDFVRHVYIIGDREIIGTTKKSLEFAGVLAL